MNTPLFIFFLILSLPGFVKSYGFGKEQGICILENKGQIVDQFGKARVDIDAALYGNGISVFIGEGSVHYQFCMPIDSKFSQEVSGAGAGRIATYRVDVTLLGSNKNAVCIKRARQQYFERYYLPQFGAEGGTAYSYESILYKEVYPGIDWLLFVKDNKLEYEFIVSEGADAGAIRIQYNGTGFLEVAADGSLHASCPLGSITEAAPYCYTGRQSGVKASYKLEKDIVSFDLAPYKGKLVIDPQVKWGTYFYGNGNSQNVILRQMVSGSSGTVYLCGGAGSPSTGLATTGAFQDTIMGAADAFLVKFDSSGNRLWCTYMGGDAAAGSESAFGMAADVAGNVYMCGRAFSSSGFGSTGSHQPVLGGGGSDAFLSKFSASGVRLWSTYYGGGSLEYASGVTTSGGFVFLSGFTQSASAIATGGAHQPALNGGGDNFLVKFDTNGVRQWATYYGGSISEGTAAYCHADTYGNVFLASYTDSDDNIATPGCHQPARDTGTDCYLVKFDINGIRLWGTYYGGEGQDVAREVSADNQGNVYVWGQTGTPFSPPSTHGIASPGSLQDQATPNIDGFIVKFNSTGQRIWGTYFGGPGKDGISEHGMSIDAWGNSYVVGTTDTQGIPALQNALQQGQGGQADGFIVKLDSSGAMLWSSYYGGGDVDAVTSPAPDNIGNVYFCGKSGGDNNITTAGAFIEHNIWTPFLAPYLVRIYDTALQLSVNFSEKEKNAFEVYPNPTRGVFTVSMTREVNWIGLYDNMGRLLQGRKTAGRKVLFDISDKVNGIYWLRADNGETQRLLLLKQ